MAGQADSSRVRLAALGAPIDVVCSDHRLAAVVADEWSRCLRARGDDAAEPFELSIASADSRYGLATSVTQMAISRLAGRALMLHACGVSTGDGLVVAMVGRSGAGKSTAASVFGRLGFGYVSDETVAVLEDASVIAYPKPLSIVEDPAEPHGKRQEGPDALALSRAPARLSLGPLVLLERDPSATTPTIERISLLDGLLEIIPHTSFLTQLEHPLRRLATLTAPWGIHRLRYAEIEDAVGLVEALAATGPGEPETWTPAAVDPSAEPVVGFLRDGRLRRAPHHDAVVFGDEILVMVRDTPIRLQGVGTAMWLAAEGADSAGLTAAAVATFGPHPEADSITSQALDDMIRLGALRTLAPASLPRVMAGQTGDP